MMNNKIVICGTDNSGKTTLANKIQSEFPESRIVKSLGPATLEQQMEYIKENLSKEEFLIFDRFPIVEEFTCGKVLRNKNNFDNIELKQFVQDAIDRIDLFILCNPGMNNIINWGSREQMEGIKENINNLYDSYLKLALELNKTFGIDINNKLITYDWSNDSIEKVIGRISDEY